MKPKKVSLLNRQTRTMMYMNVVITCKLFQTVFPAVGIRKIQQVKQQSNKQSQSHL